MGKNTFGLLKAEIIARWPIDPDVIPPLHGTPAQLANLLHDNFGFSNRRASAEAEELFSEFETKLRRATHVPTSETSGVVRRFAA
jgi:hypothetical protein